MNGDAPKGEVPTKEGGKGEKEGKAKPKAAKPVEKKQATKKEKVTKTSKRVHHVTLKSAATFTTPVPPITDAVVADCIARNKEMLEVEERKRIDAEAKNRVEAYALDTRDRMGEDEEQIGAVSTEEQRKELLAMFEEVEEWLYEGGRSVRHTVYQAKEDEMRAKGEPIFARLAELEARPAAVESARATITSGIETVGTWAEAKPQITEEETAKTLELATNVTSWLDEVVALQAPLEQAVRVLGKKPKPKPKVEEANTTATNATGSEDAAPAEAKEAGESKPAGGEGAAEGAAEPKKDEL
ncbi:hypothetical protein T492DRAFT_1138319 [Pavlovales sp. CCMP2436]|nr:hypothetical protein T492DRAFT_1138319 [Pavlovales sp. CCMP2436]